MNLRHLRYLAALAREGNFHRAAASAHISQPTLSAAIRSLERELGVELVRRDHRRYQGLSLQAMWCSSVHALCLIRWTDLSKN